MLKIFILVAIVVTMVSTNSGQRHFAGKIFDSLRKLYPNQDVSISPHSAYNALMIAYFGAKGETALNLANNLISTESDVDENAKPLRAELNGIQFKSLAKLYITNEAELK